VTEKIKNESVKVKTIKRQKRAKKDRTNQTEKIIFQTQSPKRKTVGTINLIKTTKTGRIMEQRAFKSCKQLFEYKHLLLLRDNWWSKL
jgi:hypothetical protein